jgi:hypothetical protein
MKSESSTKASSTEVLHFFSGHSVWKAPYDEAGLRRSTGWTRRCFSYFYVRHSNGSFDSRRDIDLHLDGYVEGDPRQVFLDSGAFTFLTKRPDVDKKEMERYLADYVDYVRTWLASPRARALYAYATFDYTRDPAVVYSVTMRLRKMGLEPMPVWHCVADPQWLERYMKEGFKLIGIGFLGTGDQLNRAGRKQFLRMAFHLAERYDVRLHGLGMSGSEVLSHPWASVDSTTWIQSAFRGGILMIDPVRKTVRNVHVSNEAKALRSNGSFDMLDPRVRRGLVEQVERLGFQMDDLRRHGFYRACFNVRQFELAMRGSTSPVRSWGRIV